MRYFNFHHLIFPVALYFCFKHFVPWSASMPLFNADQAIPVIMAQEPIKSLDSLYYYGQARFGSWPFISVYAFSKLLHFIANLQTLYGFSFFCLLGTLIFFAKTFFPSKTALVLSFLYALIAMIPALNTSLFSIAFVYTWQIIALMLYACFVKKLLQEKNKKTDFFLCIFFACLAIWSTPLSTVLIAMAIPFFIFQKIKKTKLFLFLLTFLIPCGLEFVLRSIYITKSSAFQQDANYYLTLESILPLKLFISSLKLELSKISNPILLFLSLGNLLCLYSTFKNKSKFIFSAILYCNILAILNFMICTLSLHVYMNQKNSFRYLFPSYFFICLASTFSFSYFMNLFKYKKIFSYINILIILGLTSKTNFNEDFKNLKLTAHMLETTYPNILAFGDYNEIYSLRGLQVPKTAIIPFPSDTEINRMPWLKTKLEEGKAVLISPSWQYNKTNPAKLKTKEFTAYGYVFKHENSVVLNGLALERYIITQKLI